MANKASKNITGGDRIRGSLEPYKGTAIVRLKHDIDAFHACGTIAPQELYYELRNVEKENVGELFRKATHQCNRYTQITKDSRAIIQGYLKQMKRHPHCHTFVNCVLDSYNDCARPYRLNTPRCKTKQIKKALQHAVKDSTKGMQTYVKPVLKHLEKHEGKIDDDVMGRYRDINGAVVFICHYFMNLFCGRMPRTMSATLFEAAIKRDSRLGRYYMLNVDTNQYQLVGNKKIMYKYLNQECITQILCPKKEC